MLLVKTLDTQKDAFVVLLQHESEDNVEIRCSKILTATNKQMK